LFLEVENAYLGVQRVNSVVRDLALHRKGSLRLVSHATVGGALVPRAIAQFHASHPEVRLTFECLRQSSLKERLLNQQADLGVTLFPMEHPNLDSTGLCQAGLMCVLPMGHALEQHAQLSPDDLRTHPLISYEQGTPFGLLIERIFEDGSPPELSTLEAGTPRDACALVQAGVGLAIVDEFSAAEFAGTGLLSRPLAVELQLQALVVYKRYEPMSKASHAFINILRKAVGKPTAPRRRHAGSPRTE
jgi:DNA-binding transcriptional LysR family regulator